MKFPIYSTLIQAISLNQIERSWILNKSIRFLDIPWSIILKGIH